MAKNMVIAGDYMGKPVGNLGGQPQIMVSSRWSENELHETAAIDSNEVNPEETSKRAASGVARCIVGGALRGPVVMMASSLSAKSKGTITLAVMFKDGKRSLLEIDGKIYKAIIQRMF